MPDLGKYAVEVLGAYGVTIVLLAGLIVATVAQYRRTRERLDEAEKRRHHG